MKDSFIKILQKLRELKYRIIFMLIRIPETIRYMCCNKKILLNVWIELNKNKVLHRNFGDELNFYLIKKLSKKRIFNQSNILCKNHENIMIIGSIIEMNTNKNSIIWGSGAMYGGQKKILEKPKKVLAVRGPLTRDFLLSQGVDCPEVYGDPALLLPLIYQPKVTKKYKLGIIPHYRDIDSEFLVNLKEDKEVKIFKLKGYDEDWQKMLDEICACEFIVSSSLHGLIISDAYNIPNLWIKLSNKIGGGNFKFHDYFMSVGRNICEPVTIEHIISKEELYGYKNQYQSIVWNPEKLLKAAPFELQLTQMISQR